MKIGIVGTGSVGGACAYACVLREIGTDIVLVDKNYDLARAQAEDLVHATPFSHAVPVRAGSFDDLEGCGIVILAAGANHKQGQTRLDLLKQNGDVFSAVVPEIVRCAPNAILLVVTNPVDIMTQLTMHIARGSGVPSHRVIGSGTILDTARFRVLLGQYLDVSCHSVHAYVLGEHGDSEVLHWSGAMIGTIPLLTFSKETRRLITSDLKAQIDTGVRKAAARIIEGKGSTYYGIGAAVARMARAIIDNENAVLTCSLHHDNICGVENVALSLPVILNAGGAEQVIRPLLDMREEEELRRSASILRDAANAAGYR